MVAGEPRVRYLHTEPGAGPDVRAAWAEVLGGRASVYLREEAVSAGMFGPVAASHLERIGDVVVVCSGDAAVLASAHEPRRHRAWSVSTAEPARPRWRSR